MKRVISILVVVLLAISFCAAAGNSTDLTGTWLGRQVRGGNGVGDERPTAASLTVAQKGSAFTGTFTGGEAKAAAIQAGRLGPNGKITFSLHDSQNYLITAQLVLSDDTLQGRMTTSTGVVTFISLRKQ